MFKLFAACAVLFGFNAHVNAEDNGLKFLVMGDWGGDEHAPFTTDQEIETSKGMALVGKQLDINYALALGDNFYHYGVTNLSDPRFNTTFENVFAEPWLGDNFTFHVIAGNHDHNGNVTAQVLYSNISKHWSFPNFYYDFVRELDGVSVHFVMLDTVIISGSSHGINKDVTVDLKGDQLPGPADPLAADSQLEWLEATLKASTADYIIVNGHYPLYSICQHGPSKGIIDMLPPLFKQYNVSAFLNGHDHCAQHIDVGDYTQYHTIGSAHKSNPDDSHRDTITPDQLKFYTGTGFGGFASVAADQDGLVITHRDGNGKVLYVADAILSR